VFQWADGSSYEGDFNNNNIEGIGVYVWAGKFIYSSIIDSRKYEGEWLNNKMNGKGIFYFPDGKIYKGNYVADKKEGYGELIW